MPRVSDVCWEAEVEMFTPKARKDRNPFSTMGVIFHRKNPSQYQWAALMDTHCNRLFHQVGGSHHHQEGRRERRHKIHGGKHHIPLWLSMKDCY